MLTTEVRTAYRKYCSIVQYLTKVYIHTYSAHIKARQIRLGDTPFFREHRIDSAITAFAVRTSGFAIRPLLPLYPILPYGNSATPNIEKGRRYIYCRKMLWLSLFREDKGTAGNANVWPPVGMVYHAGIK